MKKLIVLPLSVAAVLFSGCSTPHESNSAPAPAQEAPAASPASTDLEGSWKGRDVTPGQEASASLKFTGQNIEFHGATDDDWMKGTFTTKGDASPKQLIGVVTDCSNSDMIGKKCYAIYKIDDGTLTISGNPIGTEEFPASFDASGAREFVLKHE